MVENQVNLTCQVKKFYPQTLQLTWLENGNISWTEMALTITENKDGTYSQTSWLLINSSAHRESAVFTWQVEHDRQLAVTGNLTLEVSAKQKEQSSDTTPGEAPLLLTSSFETLSLSKCLLENHLEVCKHRVEF
jgi:signal-regulatory protein alpha/beta1/gamma